MKNSSGKVIYVGKSRALKNRVSQYFHDNNFNSKTDAMTHNVYDFDYIICETEMEALTLENSLIKLYRPRYNILLKDDKSYPYLVATLGEEYPRLIMSRKREAGKNKYYGPYSGANTVYSVISALRKPSGFLLREAFSEGQGQSEALSLSPHGVHRSMRGERDGRGISREIS